ncbi:MAG: P8 [Corparats virus 1]|nr:MAG: P8 [Corparats virus 1]
MFQYVKVEQIPNVKIFVYINEHHKTEMRKYLRQYYGINVSEGDFTTELKNLLTNNERKEDTLENDYAEVIYSSVEVNRSEIQPFASVNKNKISENEINDSPFDLLCEPIYDRKTSINDVRWKANHVQEYDTHFQLDRNHLQVVKRVPSDENVDNTFRIHARNLKPLGTWEVVRDDQKKEIIYSTTLTIDKIKPEMDGIARIDVNLWNEHANQMLYLMTKNHVIAQLTFVFKYIKKHKTSNSFVHVFPMLTKSRIGDFYFDTSADGNMIDVTVDGLRSSESQCDNFIWMLGIGWDYLKAERFEDLDYRIWFKNISLSILEWIAKDDEVRNIIKRVYHLEHSDYGIKCFRIEW